MIICGHPDLPGATRRLSEKVLQTRRVQQPHQDPFFYSPGVTEPAPTPWKTRQAARRVPGMTAIPDAAGSCPATIGPRDAPPHAGQVVRRVLLRRNIVIDAETARLVADAVQAALQAGASSRPPRRGWRAPVAGCEPLF
jgi:hypothetical protein